MRINGQGEAINKNKNAHKKAKDANYLKIIKITPSTTTTTMKIFFNA